MKWETKQKEIYKRAMAKMKAESLKLMSVTKPLVTKPTKNSLVN